MLRSLLQTNPDAEVTVLCLDDRIGAIINSSFRDRVSILEAQALFDAEPKLIEIFKERAPWEAYATLKSVFVDYWLGKIPENECLWYIDADTYFYNSLGPVYEEMNGASVGISPHRFNDETLHWAVFGNYNAGLIVWRNNEIGRQCAQDWRVDCLAWCYQSSENEGFYMNQGYLNKWPNRYPGVRVLSHPGANLARWNLASHQLSQDATGVRVDQQPLIFYHFSDVWRDPLRKFPTTPGTKLDFQLLAYRSIYRPYLAALSRRSLYLRWKFGITGVHSMKGHDFASLSLRNLVWNLIR